MREQPTLRRALFLGCALQAAQQLAGINTVLYFSATIFRSGGVTSEVEAIWLASGVAGVNFIFTVLGIWLVERFGRRKLLLFSLAGVIAVLVALGFGFFVSDLRAPGISSTSECPYLSCSSCIAAR